MNKSKTLRKRFAVMLCVLIVAAIGYFTVFGIGNVCGFGFGEITLACPLGALLIMISERTAIPLAIISIVVVLVLCIVLGKVFCSWVCPVHFLSRLSIFETRAKAKHKMTASACAACTHPCGKRGTIKLDSRHAILAAALGSTAIFGFPVFCLVCPVGLTFAGVLLVMRLFAFGEATWTIVAIIAVIVVEAIFLPRWCQRFCPLGALLSLFSSANRTLRPVLDETSCLKNTQGVECDLCVKACPEGINLHDLSLGATTLADCSKCKACSDVCPAQAITFPLLAKKHG